MGLITKPPSWGHCTSSITGTPSATPGTSVTANANDADGSSVAILTNVTHDVEFLIVMVWGFNTAAANSSTLLDVLIDPAGGTSWASDPLINDLLVGYTGTFATGSGSGGAFYYFPIWLKSGHSLGVRARTAHTASLTGRVFMHAYGGNANPGSWWCGTSVETIGVDDTISQGTNHTPGNTGAFSTWTNFGSTLSKPCGALQFGVHGTNTDVTSLALQYHYEFGVGSTRIGPPIYKAVTTSEAGGLFMPGPIFCALPSGTQLQVRGTCSGTAEILDVAAYAVM